MEMKVLLIVDDPSIFDMIKEQFSQWSLQIVGPQNFQKVMDDFIKEKPQLVLIDIQLPAYDGFYWCREICCVSKVPILFLPSRDHLVDMIMAKIQSILRRTEDYEEESFEVTSFNGAVIDYARAKFRLMGS